MEPERHINYNHSYTIITSYSTRDCIRCYIHQLFAGLGIYSLSLFFIDCLFSDLFQGTDEIDAALKEVTELLGGLETTGPERIDVGTHKTLISRPILCVDRR